MKSVLKRAGELVQQNEQLATLEQPALEEKKLVLSQQLKEANAKLSEDVTADREMTQRRIQRLRAQLQAIETEIAKGTLVSPFEGVVAEVNIDEGMFVLPDLVAIRIVEEGPPIVLANVPEDFALTLDSLDGVSVQMDGEFVSAKLLSRSPLFGPVPGEIVSITIGNDPPRTSWSDGEVAEVRMTAPTAEQGIWLPLSSLIRDPEAKWAVYTVTSEPGDRTGRVQRQEVNILRLENGMALVEASRLGETFIILDGTHRVVPGQVVAPVLTSKVMSDPSGKPQ